MIRVDDLELDRNLILTGRHTSGRTAGSERRTLGNRLVTQRSADSGGELVLQSISSGNKLYGHWRRHQLDRLRQWADAGGIHTLHVHGKEWTVVIPHDGLATAQLFPRSNPQAEAVYTGTVRFYVTTDN